MPKRELRIVKRIGQAPYLGVCLHCNQQFRVTYGKEFTVEDATRVVQEQFEAHKCEPVDSSQNSLRIVREATEGK
jgi:hypothetical protein